MIQHNFKKDKSHGPNGQPIEFLLVFYEIIEEDLMRVIDEYIANVRMLATFNSTFITLIRKIDNSTSF
jgi:hypothetical protein